MGYGLRRGLGSCDLAQRLLCFECSDQLSQHVSGLEQGPAANGYIHVHRLISIAVLLLSLSLSVLAGDNAELRSIKDADQADRTSVGSINWPEVAKRDAQRRDLVLEILKAGGLTTAWDYFNAALVLQHGQATEDIRLAHSLATVAATVDPTHPSAKWLMAAS